jgi:hypothetical protein
MTRPKPMGCDGTGCDGTGCDGTGCDGTGCDGTGCDGTGCDGTLTSAYANFGDGPILEMHQPRALDRL